MTIITLANGSTLDTTTLIASDNSVTRRGKLSNTVLLWQGPSVLDGAPIGAFATFKSANSKTGDMVQISILRTDINPVDAVKSGDDSAVCGNCPHRRFNNGACYVNVGHGPRAIYAAFLNDNIPLATKDDYKRFTGRMVRFGSYGDPAALPIKILKDVTKLAKGWTGYTHQLTHKNFNPEVLEFCMVSADIPKQAQKLQAQGHKTFRVKRTDQPVLEGELECLATTKALQCRDCGLCSGKNAQMNIVINAHGATQNRFKG